MSDLNGLQWKVLGWEVSKNLIVFIFQIVLVYVVVGTCLFNLTTDNLPYKELWIALLSSCVGYLLPNPSLKS